MRAYANGRKIEIQGEQQNESSGRRRGRKKSVSLVLPPTYPFVCVCILPIHQSSISITSSRMGSQLNLIYIKLISNKAERVRGERKKPPTTTMGRKKSQCHSRTWKIFIKYQFRSPLVRSLARGTNECANFRNSNSLFTLTNAYVPLLCWVNLRTR